MTATARIAVAPRARSMSASTPPATMLPSSAQKMKNLVLSQAQGWSTSTFGIRNHNHIGANHFG